MTRVDVLIVGAGPAGCGAAYDLRRAGLSVRLLDRAAFPREKPCAGALTVKTIRALRYSVEPVIRQVCSDLIVGLGVERATRLRSRHPIAAMTVRAQLDAYCLERCLARGAEFEAIGSIASIEPIERGAGGWRVLTRGGAVHEGRFLIGADGANSTVRRMLQPEFEGGDSERVGRPERVDRPDRVDRSRMGFAIETCVPRGSTADTAMQMDFGVVARGYGWIFPKRDHLNVGLFTLEHTLAHAPERLAEYARARLGVSAIGRVVGHRVPVGGRAFRHAPDGPILVGDAAGFVDPLFGEGIYNAIRSGQLAAAAIRRRARGERDAYGALVREIQDDLDSYAHDTDRFYRNVPGGYRQMTLPGVSYLLMKGIALGLTFREIKRRYALIPLMRPRRWWLPKSGATSPTHHVMGRHPTCPARP